MQWPDALGLGLFSATGTQLALAQDLPGTLMATQIPPPMATSNSPT